MPKIVKWYSYFRDAGAWTFRIVYLDGEEVRGGSYQSAREAAREVDRILNKSDHGSPSTSMASA